jgi:hypothetical protein
MKRLIEELNTAIQEAGYNWYRGMSNNAVSAYAEGKMPISKWSKKLILEKVAEFYPNVLDIAKSSSLQLLRSTFLYKSEWHHTSKYYNVTDFYGFDEDLDEPDIMEELNKRYYVWSIRDKSIIQKDLTYSQAKKLAKTNSLYMIADMKKFKEV